MYRNFLVFICLLLFEQTILLSTNREILYLPMKKDHKYGDDICYYRDEIDEKHDYAVYYVKPCEKGKYCETEVSEQPFGFCRDILTNATDFPTYEGDCNSNGECLDGLNCDNGKCKKVCDSPDENHPDFPFYDNISSIECLSYGTKTTDDGKHCILREHHFQTSDPKYYYFEEFKGKYPGLPKECGIVRYKEITEIDRNNPVITATGTTYNSYTKWVLDSKEWCTIGEAEDGDFVEHSKFCKSGFTLLFYPKGDLVDPSNTRAYYTETTKEMCVTPIQIDKSNPEVGAIVTYKIKDGNEQKYSYYKYYHNNNIAEDSVIKSHLYTEFIEEFNNSSDEDKKNCYRIPQGNVGNCQNIKLLKLYYFSGHIKEYLFYKDRKDLEKVLHFKIQKIYHRYYELGNYLNLNYLFLLLILILL